MKLTADWKVTNRRRIRLIDKEIQHALSPEEQSELAHLQVLTDLKLDMTTPLPIQKLEKQSRDMSRKRPINET
jgi:hypothetical protein